MFLNYDDFLNESIKTKISNFVKNIFDKVKKIIKNLYKTELENYEIIKKESYSFNLYGQKIFLEDGSSYRINSKDKNLKTPFEIDFFDIKGNIITTFDIVNYNEDDLADLILNFKNGKLTESLFEFFFSDKKKTKKTPKKKAIKKDVNIIQPSAPTKISVPDTSEDVNLEQIFQGDKTDNYVLDTLKMLGVFADMVIDGQSNSLIITGRPGIGKSYEVLRRFYIKNKQPKKDFIFLKGRTTPLGLYTALWQYNGKVIVFDDCDSAFDMKGVAGTDKQNLLKGALDTYPAREITWRSSKPIELGDAVVPQTFSFTGRCIFITNLSMNKIDSALMSRSLIHDVVASDDDVVAQMRFILPKIYPAFQLEMKYEALQIIVDLNKEDKSINLNLRTLIKAIILRSTNHPLWKEMIKYQCRNIND